VISKTVKPTKQEIIRSISGTPDHKITVFESVDDSQFLKWFHSEMKKGGSMFSIIVVQT
jgi:deoxyadenosine/deoxycytidine kinase